MILFGFEEVPPQILNIVEDDVKLDSVSVSFQRIHIFLLKKTIYVGNSTQKKMSLTTTCQVLYVSPITATKYYLLRVNLKNYGGNVNM